MHIEAVTVCVRYSDFLAEAIACNAGLLDRWIVVTSESDRATRELCRRHSIHTLLSEDHHRNGDGFAKGRLVERGLQHLSAQGWRLHLDADILLPFQFRKLLEAAHLDERNIYGCDRIMVRSRQDYDDLRASGWLAHDYHCRVNPPPGLQIGSRWVHHDGGYVPIGFFQLWHSSADEYEGARIRPYPARHGSACRTDVQHALQWDRNRRLLIPELLVVHLESEPAALGANWGGRTTRPFGPSIAQSPYWGGR